jgi:magnesium chelatase family protein
MISKVHSIAVNWLSSTILDVEVDINPWMPKFNIVWLPDQGVQESRERLYSALKSIKSRLPMTRITVNLAPADIRKVGSMFDLPIAIGILLNDDVIQTQYCLEKIIFLGELSLDGKIRQVSSVLPWTIGAKERGFTTIFVPKENAWEASFVQGIEVIGVGHLQEVIDHLNAKHILSGETPPDFDTLLSSEEESKYDFQYIIGQEHAKRALEIAASWGHNIIMSWPPGSGKTLLAKSLATILPNLTLDESLEISKVYSISGLLSADFPIVTKRPFRTIHHTASSVSIIGGWRNAKPGEISLSHKWVLFLDEILEFPKMVLEVLRQPLEDGYITVTRVNASFIYPAKFMLVWAMNPCPCGYLTDTDKECTCSPFNVKNYASRLSWPLIDRIDMFIEVPKVKTEKFQSPWETQNGETSKEIKKRVEVARKIQLSRFSGKKITCNAEMSSAQIQEFCKLDTASDVLMRQAVSSMNLSARSYYRILKLARTIADLWGEKDILQEHILEALSYRKKDG